MCEMGLIQDAIAEARDRSVETADLLRTCQVVAFRLKHQGLKEWVNHELSGYPADDELPSYRVLDGLRLKGTFVNPARWMKGVDVPLGAIPQAYHQAATRTQIRAPVAELEGLVRNSSGSLRTHPIPADVFTQLEILELSTTIDLWCELSAHAVGGLVDQIRTRALTLLLEVEAANPDAGDAVGTEPPVSLEKVGQIVQNVIFAGNVLIAPAAQAVVQQVVQAGEMDSLLAWAREAGIAESDVLALPDAITKDGQDLSKRTQEWIRRAATGAGRAGREVAVGVIEAAIRRYLGLP